MNEVSNKTIVALLAVALVVSIAGTLYSVSELNELGGTYSFLTGAQSTAQGTGDINITGELAISLTDAAIDWGHGYVDGAATAVLPSNQTALPSNWINDTEYMMGAADYFTLENNGTVVASVNVTADNHAETWLCAAGACTTNTAQLDFAAYHDQGSGEASSCTGSGGDALQTDWTTIATHDAVVNELVCGEFSKLAASNALGIGLQVTVPYDAETGVQQITVTFTGKDATT